MKLDEFAKRTGLSKRTIHFYIDKKLLKPKKSGNNYYDFSPDDVDKLKTIILLRKAGMPIEYINELSQYPAWLNYYLSKTVKRLKAEIEDKQARIENALLLLDTIAPHATPADLDISLIEKMTGEPKKESISDLYDVNDDFMVATFLLVQYIDSEKNFYKRYIWNKISIDLRHYLGNMMDFLLDVIYTRDIDLMTEDVTCMTLYWRDLVENEKHGLCVEHLVKALQKLFDDEELLQKWTVLYEPFIKPLISFYREKADEMINAYNPNYQKHLEKIHQVIKERHCKICGQPNYDKIRKNLAGIFDFDAENVYSDYFILYLFDESFYTKVDITQIIKYI